MTPWLVAALVVMVCGLGAGLVLAVVGDVGSGLAGLSLAGTMSGVCLLLLSRGLGRASYVDVAAELAVLSPIGILVFARFVGRPR